MQAEEGRASLNNESIDPAADDGSGCYDDRGSVTQSVEKVFVSLNQQSHVHGPNAEKARAREDDAGARRYSCPLLNLPPPPPPDRCCAALCTPR